ncbi:MAG: thiamine pyrophosphate-binding protein, partial [Candidatus Eremiobacteraeota bacterium]|nr:thiamine pyrophosphate-binding protein [Candidatus Eremiobacteraeota bacterium]
MNTEVRLADYVFELLAREGLKAAFLVPGGGSMHLVDALGKNRDIRFIANHHEQASSIAAEAYARVTGHFGCALVTTGPGSTNAITGVAGAWIESVPLLILSGQVKRADMIGNSGVRQKGPQEVDIISMVRSITKYAVTVMDPRTIRYHLEKAIHFATTGRRGPVWLDIPLDVQAAPIDPSEQRGYQAASENACAAAAPADADVNDIITLIDAAERPLIVAGHGIRLAGAAGPFRELYEMLGIPVVTTWNASDLIEAEHHLAVGKPGTVALRAPNFAVANSDLIIAIGARLDNVVTAYNPAKFGRAARKILVDVDSAELAKFGDDAGIAKAIVSDAKAFIEALLRRRGSFAKRDRTAWLRRCGDWKRKYPINDGRAFPREGEISHYHLTQALSDEIPPDTLIVTGSSGLAIEIFYTAFRNKPGQRVFLTSGLGSMGYGLPAMIGASIAYGNRPLVGIEGDGSMMMNIQELQTIRALQIPVRIFVFDNGGYASIRNTQRNYFEGRFVGTHPEAGLGMPDFVKLAEANGIPALRIDDAADLRANVQYVLSQPGPFLCDVKLLRDETLWPKSATLPQPDGSIVSMPLEDMSPLLPRDE